MNPNQQPNGSDTGNKTDSGANLEMLLFKTKKTGEL